MKRLFLLIAMLALGGLMAWAQTNAQSNSTSGTSATSNQTSTDQTSNPSTSNTATPGAATSTQDNTGAAATQDQTGTAGAQDQTGTAATSTQTHKSKSGHLPQTASPLPFLGMIGFGSMAAGMMIRKIRK